MNDFVHILSPRLVTGAIAAVFAIVMIVCGPAALAMLILKYLRKRRIAWVSLVAVMLCTTMVLVVISVMGGWLRMFRQSFHGISGDVLVTATSPAGFPYYQEMDQRIQSLPQVEATAPVIKTWGLLKIEGSTHGVDAVQVVGYQLDRITKVNDFAESLFRQHLLKTQAGQLQELNRIPDYDMPFWQQLAKEPEAKPSFSLLPGMNYAQAYTEVFPHANDKVVARVDQWPGMIVGAGLIGIRRGVDGRIQNRYPIMYRLPAKLTVLGLEYGSSRLDLEQQRTEWYWIVDDSRTKVWQYDSNTVYVPFDVLQRDLGMEQHTDSTPEGQSIVTPARATELNIKVRPGYDLVAARDAVREQVNAVLRLHGLAEVNEEEGIMAASPVKVQTWEQFNATWLHAIENEKTLVVVLFGIISVVAIFLIFCIFYMIVVEKTRDIGIVKSVGATSSGVAGIFLGYGLAIGIVGAGLGLLLGYLIVHNINFLHEKVAQLLGQPIWNPEVYAFDTIPNTMNPHEVAIIVAVAVAASVAGSLVPAIRAARMHPVEALRWE